MSKARGRIREHNPTRGLRLAFVDNVMRLMPNRLFDPLTDDLMVDPVRASDGRIYERESIVAYIEQYAGGVSGVVCSPMTGVPLDSTMLVPALEVRLDCMAWRRETPVVRLMLKFRARRPAYIDAPLTVTIGSVKASVTSQPDDMIVTYHGHEVSDGCILDELGIHTDTLLHLSLVKDKPVLPSIEEEEQQCISESESRGSVVLVHG